MKNKDTLVIVLSFLVFVLLVLLSYMFLKAKYEEKVRNIDTYQECVDAGYPVAESYPSVCRTPDGRSFTNPDEVIEDGTEADGGDTESGDVEPKAVDVRVYFSKGLDDPSLVGYVMRSSSRTDIGTYTIEQLIKGPTSAEKSQGFLSPLSFTGAYKCTSNEVELPIDFKLVVDKGTKVATITFCRDVNSSGVGTDGRITSTVTATLNQFSTVDKVIILDSNGNCFGDMSGLNNCLK
ncbi:GerMN domain-containing protein [Candidatus Dojkabacteria bacterium]|nr:GerMN domain-containing protein [Candidatus Dojkabacteria bacterium]